MDTSIDLYGRAKTQGWIGMIVGTVIAVVVPMIYFPIGMIASLVGFARGFALWNECRGHYDTKWLASSGKKLMFWSVFPPLVMMLLWVTVLGLK